MEIRQAVAADLARIAVLFEQLGYPNTVEELEQRWPVFVGTDGEAWVAEVDGLVIGVLVQNYVLPLNALGVYAVVSAFVVDQTVRRHGAGAALIAHAEGQARVRGCTHTELSSSMRRAPAHLFYLAQGFQDVPKRFVKEYSPRARPVR